MKRIIETDKAPQAIGPYSQATEINGTLYISGQIAIDPATGLLIESDIKAQADLVLQNIGAILEAAGYTYENVVKSTVLLTTMDHFADMNEVYNRYYAVNRPARAAFAALGLPKGALVEIETIAVKDSQTPKGGLLPSG
ncbi:MAG: RidA family protein [Bacteroidia bacterium]|nr:RidA family protein [Bacteroidia bacterium]